jgi:hypothetical protein
MEGEVQGVCDIKSLGEMAKEVIGFGWHEDLRRREGARPARAAAPPNRC